MKRILMTVLAIAVVLMAFTSCRQVYIPWPLPGMDDDVPVVPAGDPITDIDDFADAVKNGGTFYLADDIKNMPVQLDLTTSNGAPLVIDGNGKSIFRNVPEDGDQRTKAIVLISSGNVTLKNITIDGTALKDIVWNNGEFGIKVYGAGANVTLENVTVTNCNAAILVDGGKVTLNGTIDLSGNKAGGINVDKRSGNAGTVTIASNTNLICNGNEVPVIWLDDNQDRGTINDNTNSLTTYHPNAEGKTAQIWYLTPSQAAAFGGTLSPTN